MTINLTSTAFADGAAIPKKYTGDGQDVSPNLNWSDLPDGTKQLALICDDPDAPVEEPWVHWVIYHIPPDTKELPEGVPPEPKLAKPPEALQGKNSWPSGRTLGYRGPAPPKGHGTHHYHFKLYAIDKELGLDAGATKKQLQSAMKGHVLAQGELVGTYER